MNGNIGKEKRLQKYSEMLYFTFNLMVNFMMFLIRFYLEKTILEHISGY